MNNNEKSTCTHTIRLRCMVIDFYLGNLTIRLKVEVTYSGYEDNISYRLHIQLFVISIQQG